MQSILENKIIIDYDDKKVKIDVYDTPLGERFIEALKDNLVKKRILEKLKSLKKNFKIICLF